MKKICSGWDDGDDRQGRHVTDVYYVSELYIGGMCTSIVGV